MSMDTELQKHYALLLGIGSPWEVKTVELKLAEKKVEIELGWQWGQAAKCPECGVACSIRPFRACPFLSTPGGLPNLEAGLRGLAFIEVVVKPSAKDAPILGYI
jgi:hypothetical protein